MITHKLIHRHIHEPPALHEEIAGIELARCGHDDLTLDFSVVEFISSPIIGILAKTAYLQRQEGNVLVLSNVSPAMKVILELSGIGKVAEIET